jgi:hypothetical protein
MRAATGMRTEGGGGEDSDSKAGSAMTAGAAPETFAGPLTETKRPRFRGAGSELSPGLAVYALNDLPHPQPPVALGFSTENPAPRKSST